MYPNEQGARFDHAYYRDTHLPLLKQRLGPACIRYAIDKGITGALPHSNPPYVASCHIYSESIEVYRNAIAEHAPEIIADIANFTSLAPVVQFSDVIVG
jgi:uncharacterized protein (TIGR02118 family)